MARRRILTFLLLPLLGAPAHAQTPKKPADAGGMPAATDARIHVIGATLGNFAVGRYCIADKTVTRQCEGRSQCRVTAADTICDPDSPPQEMLIATLTVQFRCSPQDEARTARVERPLGLSIACHRPVPLPTG
jgi:hypothetical protein